MIKKILTISILSLFVYAENTPQMPMQPQTQVQPQVLAQQKNNGEPEILQYEQVLKRLQEKSAQEESAKATSNSQNNTNGTNQQTTSTSNGDFNVVGIAKIDNESYCYLLTPENKVIKAKQGMIIKGKKINSIVEFGIYISDSNNNEGYLPIIENQVNEIDVTFFNKETPNKPKTER